MARSVAVDGVYARNAVALATVGTEDDFTLLHQEPSAVVRACRQPTRKGFRTFYKYVCGMDPAPHMDEWINELIPEEDSRYLRGIYGANTNILAPRGSAKSTVLTFFVAWAIGIHYDPDWGLALQIMYLSYSQTNAEQKSDEIRTIIETPLYREVFPWARPSRTKWGSKKWMMDKQHAGINPVGTAAFTLVTAGILGAIVSKRTHLIIIDDIIKSPQSIENPAIREKMETNWESAARPTLLEGGRAFSLGTRFRADDINCTKFCPIGGWVLLEQSAILESEGEDGSIQRRSYWPEMYTLQYLENYERDAPIDFLFQYQNRLGFSKKTGIHPDWVIKAVMPNYFDYLAVGGDLASGKKNRNDYSVFVLGGRKDNRFYMLDMIRNRWVGNIDKLDALLEMLSLWGIVDVEYKENGDLAYFPTDLQCHLFIESNAYQSSLKGDFESYVQGEHQIYNLIYKKQNSIADKDARFQGIVGPFQQHHVYWNQYADFKDMYREITNYGATAHDDCCDALEKVVNGLRGRRKLQAA